MQDNQMLVDEWLSQVAGRLVNAAVGDAEWKELKALVASMPASWFKYGLTNLIQEIEVAR